MSVPTRRTYLLVPNISPSEVHPQLVRKSGRKYELVTSLAGSNTVSFPLEARDTAECVMFLKKEYVWKGASDSTEGQSTAKPQTKVVYEAVDTRQTGLQMLQPSKFLDFRYKGRLERDDVVSFFESVALGKRPPLDLENLDFRQELYPKVFARDYVHASIPIE